MYHVLFCLAAFLPTDDVKTDQALLGSWRVTKLVNDHEQHDDKVGAVIVFTANEIKPSSEPPAQYTLNPEKSPRQIDLITPQQGTMLGIYEVKGDTLRLCVQRKGDRPTTFDAKGLSIVYLEAKREKK